MVEAALRPQPQDVPRLIGKSRPLERAGREEQNQAAEARKAEAVEADAAAAAAAATVDSEVCCRQDSPGLPLGFDGGHDYDQIKCN